MSNYIIGWVNDINHNRRVLVESTQKHAGADLGLATTNYPDTSSFSRVSFLGNGKIYPPVPDFNASIIETDANKSQTYDSCKYATDRAQELNRELEEDNILMADLQERMKATEQEAGGLESQNAPDDAQELRNALEEYNFEMSGLTQASNCNTQEISELTSQNSQCNFSGSR